MNTVASMGLLAKLPSEAATAPAPPSAEDTRAAVLAKKAAQARARREKKKAGAVPVKTAPKAKAAPKVTPKAPPAKPKTANLFPPVAEEKVIPAKIKRATGGAREGAGRRPLHAGETMRTISFKGTAAQHAEFLAAGGGLWVRAGLDERIAFKAKKGGK